MTDPPGNPPSGSGAPGSAPPGVTPPGADPAEQSHWMGVALAAARRAEDSADVPIGAVVVGPDGRALGVACNERELHGDPTGHAELLAIRRAAARLGAWRLDGCFLAVTLEPCVMCAGAIVLARLPLVIFGAWDEKAGAVGSVYDVLRDRRLNHRVEVYGGVREQECSRLLTDFFQTHRDSAGMYGEEGDDGGGPASFGPDGSQPVK